MPSDMPTISGDANEIDWQAAVRRLQFLIDTNHYNISDVAHDLGIRSSVFMDILDGRQRPSNAQLLDAARYFGVTIDFLTSAQTVINAPPRKRPASEAGRKAPPAPSASGPGKSSSARSGASGASSRPGARPAPRPSQRPGAPASGRSKPVGVSDVAIRHQALVEILIEKGVFTAAEFNAKVQQIRTRR